MKSVLPALFFACAVTRLAAADFTVTNTNNSGPGSLYQAITDANNLAGADRILFNIPGAGVHQIDVSQNPLPIVLESLVIDGYSQPGAKPNVLTVGNDAVILIQIDGGADSVAPATGLVFSGASSDYVVRGLCLTGFGAANSSAGGVAITAGQVHSAIVSGNFIGVLPDGETARGNHIGVGHVTQLGGTDPASRNVISGNSIGFAGDAAPAPGASVYGAVVQGNYIGTNASGTKAIPNVEGIGLETVSDGRSPCNGTESSDVDLSKTVIGGASGATNIISGNGTGIRLGRIELCSANPDFSLPVRANGVQIQGNVIGADSGVFGGTLLPNGSGILIVAGSNNRISQNYIFGNNERGIDLGGDGATPNDLNDADSGPNNFQNYPVINSVTISSDGRGRNYAVGHGTFNSTPNSTFQLEFFISNTRSGARFGLGEYPAQVTNVTTDANGNASFPLGFQTDPGRPIFTVTATDSAGNTSEFSPGFLVPAPHLVNLSTRSPVGSGERVLIGGFIIVGTDNKKVILRGLGPSLANAGVTGVLADPTLELHDSTGALLASNNNWKETQADEVNATGIPPGNDAESAIVATLPAGPPSQGGATYTGILAGNYGTTGIGVLEIYDLAMDANSRLANISTRGYVGAGANVLIGGFIPRPAARSSLQVLIRALGPSLAPHGVSDTLQDPTLELHDANGTSIVSNDNWRDSPNASQIAATGIPPGDDHESAIIYFVPAGTDGSYTGVVRGVNSGSGVALVEVYALN